MYFVSLSYKDITPTKLGFFKTDFFIEKPLIYLQHGTLGIKAIEYKGYGYNNNMFRFCITTRTLSPLLWITINSKIISFTTEFILHATLSL